MSQFAVIKTGGKQYKVSEGDVISIDKIETPEGGSVAFDQVLLVADSEGKNVKIGAPMIAGAKVEAKVLEQGRGRKIIIAKYKPKVHYRRKRGFRPMFTKVQIGIITS